MKVTNDCSCNTCKKACEFKPGWMIPGEAEKVAKYLGITLEELFQNKLMIDFWAGEENIFLLSPATINNTPGNVFPYNPKGRCVFYKDGKCEIHTVKPFECREYDHNSTSKEVQQRHENVAKSWTKHQDLIIKLNGGEPILPDFDFDSFLSFF